MTDPKHPPLTYTTNGKEIRWTYGLQQDLTRMVPQVDSLMDAVMDNAYARDYLIRRVLTDHKGFVTDPDTQLILPDDVMLSPDEEIDLLEWIAGHLLYFFVTSPLRVKALAEKYELMLNKTTQSVRSETGSPS